jgi:parallel beta-helix repeat protein
MATSTPAPTSGREIGGCTIIDQSGTYALTTDLTNINESQLKGSSYQADSDACIDIRASDVVIRGNGHRLDWDHTEYAVDQRGVYVNGTQTHRENVTIRNLTVTDWPRGAWVQDASEVLIEGVTTRPLNASRTRGRIAIQIYDASESVFRGNSFEEYPGAIHAGGFDSHPNRGNRYVGNQIQDGTFNIKAEANLTVADNRLQYEPGSGLVNYISSAGGSVANNSVDSGGIDVSGSNLTVAGNTVKNQSAPLTSDQYALEIDGLNHIVRNNTISENNNGLAVAGRDHRLRNNAMRDNRENLHLGAFHESSGRTLTSIDADTSNTVNGDPVYVFDDVSGETFSKEEVGYLAYVDSSDITIRDVVVTNNTEGLLLYNVTESTVEDTTFHENRNGIEVISGDGLTVERTNLSDNTRTGLLSRETDTGTTDLTVHNNTVSGARTFGLDLAGTNLTVTANEVSDNGEGIDVTGQRLTVRSNTLTANDRVGVRATGDDVTIRENRVTENGNEGIFIDFWRDNEYEVVGNNASNNGGSGVRTDANGGRFLNNTLLDNGGSGIHIRGGGAAVRNNTARNNRWGLRLYHYDAGLFDPEIPVDDNLIADNVVTGNEDGIAVGTTSGDNTIRNNTATGNGVGIYLDNVRDHRIQHNNVSGNTGDGIHFDEYDQSSEFDTKITNNTATRNGDDGIELEDARPPDADDESGPFIVRDNEVSTNENDGIVVENARNVSVLDNGVVDDNDGAAIDIEDSDDIAVSNHTTTGNGVGLLVTASDLTIRKVNASGNEGDGIRLDDVSGLDLGEEVRVNGNAGDGLSIVNSNGIHIDSVPANDNGHAGIVLIDSRDSTLRDLSASDNGGAGLEVKYDDGPSPTNVTALNVTLGRNAVGANIYLADGVTIANNSTVVDSDASKGQYEVSTGSGSDEYVVVNGTGVVAESASNVTIRGATIANNEGRGIVMTRTTDGTRIVDSTIGHNGGTGIEFVGASGPATVSNDSIIDNGRTDLFGPSSVAVNGEYGIRLRDASNVSVAGNRIERNADQGVRIRGNSDDNAITGNLIRSHTTANGTGHGIYLEGFLVDTPVDNRIADNEITENDYGVSLFDEFGSLLHDNEVSDNTIGVRLGSSTQPTSITETTTCTEGGVLTTVSRFGGATDGAITGNEIEGAETALKLIVYPSRTTNCDGTITGVYYDDPTIEGYTIANNHFEAPEPLNVTQSRLDVPGDTYDAELNGSNDWNVSKTTDGNVLGGPYRAGNYWAKPDGTGFSQSCIDSDGDGICDSAKEISTNNVDHLPLASDQPTYVKPAIDSTTSPVTVGEALSVTVTFTNSGDARASQTVALSVNDTRVDSASLSLAPGNSTTETFSWTPASGDVGPHTATVASADDAVSTTITVDPNVSVGIDATNTPITETQPLIVSATATNNRPESITETVELLDFEGSVVDATTVDLSAGESASVDLEWVTEAGDVGSGDVTVRSKTDATQASVTIRSGTISGCTEITEPGAYRLTGDLSASSAPCIEVRTDDVSIDGMGYNLTGPGSGPGIQIDVGQRSTDDVTVRNLTIRDASTAIEMPVGDQQSVSDVAFRNVTTESVDGNALFVELGKNSTVDGLTIADGEWVADAEGILIEDDFEEDVTVRDVGVRNTTLTAGEVGIDVDLADDRPVIDGFELANSTLNASDEGVVLNVDEQGSETRDVTIANSTIESGFAALEFVYSYDGATFGSVRITDNRFRSDSEEGVYLEADDTGTTTRNLSITDNDVRTVSTGVALNLASDEVTVDGLRVMGNRIEANDDIGLSLTASSSGATVAGTAIRNNTIVSATTGMELELGDDFSSGSAYHVTVADNEISGVTQNGIDLREIRLNATTDLVVSGNEIRNESGDVTGIEVAMLNGSSPTEATIHLEANEIRTRGDAIVIGSADFLEAIDISRNVLAVGGFGVDNRATSVGGRAWVNATNNYWGTSDGPGSTGPYEDPLTGALADGNGSTVTTGSAPISNVHFDPFLTTPPTLGDTDPGETIPGDVTGDGVVNVFDLVRVGRAWNTAAGDPRYSVEADVNGDGEINILDASVIGRNWQQTTAESGG